jgi:mRNA-degrading endonuclease RelE of RelBE toxin-antitoxin system
VKIEGRFHDEPTAHWSDDTLPPARLRWSYVCLKALAAMYQVNFSEQAMRELNKLDTLTQLKVMEPLSGLKPDDLSHPREPLGRFHRKNKEYYRLRADDYRFYFEVTGETLHVHYILHHNTLEDFLLRNKLPVTEQQLVEQNSKFWKYLETLTK